MEAIERDGGKEKVGRKEKEEGRRSERARTTKYKECNVLLPPVRYTFHRILLGHVQRNNKDKDVREERPIRERPVADFMDAKNRLARERRSKITR